MADVGKKSWRRLSLEMGLKPSLGYVTLGDAFCIGCGLVEHGNKRNGTRKMKPQEQRLTRKKKTQVRLSDLCTRPDVFQYRDNEVENYHVEAMVDVIKQQGTVDPVDVWEDPSNGELVVIDGHHRYAAFHRVATSSNIKIPVVLWEGTEDAARLHALRENTKARLQMTPSERANAAWRLVCRKTDEGKPVYSKAEIVNVTGVADRTVANMRRTLKRLESEDEPIPETWKGALAQLNGIELGELTDEDREEIIEQRAQRLDEKVGKDIAQMADIQIEAVQRMLERRLGSKTDTLAEWWRVPCQCDDPF